MDVPSFLRETLEEAKLTQAQLSKKIGVSQGTISKWINEGHAPNKRQWDAVLKFASRYPRLRAMVKDGIQQSFVPLMGRVGGGAEIEPDFEQVPPDGLDQIELPFPVRGDVVAFRVEGESMRPAYRDGDVVLVRGEQLRDTDDFIGKEVAVRTVDGKRYLKELQRGQRRGQYDLYSHNATVITGARIAWVGEICAVVKADQLRSATARDNRKRAS